MNRAPARRRPLTLGEHFFWTLLAAFSACILMAVVLSA